MNVALAIARRNLRHAFTNPALLLPSVLFPLIFLVSFAGGLSSVDDVPGFGFRSGYTSFQFVFVYLQSASFGGLFTGIAIAADFESRFIRRLFVAAPKRSGIILGYLLSGAVRFAFTTTLVTVVGLLAGMEVDGSASQFLGLVTLGFLLNAAATLFSCGFSLRAQSMQAAPAMQIPTFMLLMTTPVYVPRDLLAGWIETASAINPATAIVEAGRSLMAGDPFHVGLAFVAVAGLAALMLLFAARGLRKAEANAA